MSAWRTWSLDKNFLPFRTRKKQTSKYGRAERKQGNSNLYWTVEEAIQCFPLFLTVSSNYPSLHLFIQQKKTLTFQHIISQVRRTLRRCLVQALLQSGDSSGIRPKADSKHGLPVRWNFLYKECFNRIFLTLNMAYDFSMLSFINCLYQLF